MDQLGGNVKTDVAANVDQIWPENCKLGLRTCQAGFNGKYFREMLQTQSSTYEDQHLAEM